MEPSSVNDEQKNVDQINQFFYHEFNTPDIHDENAVGTRLRDLYTKLYEPFLQTLTSQLNLNIEHGIKTTMSFSSSDDVNDIDIANFTELIKFEAAIWRNKNIPNIPFIIGTNQIIGLIMLTRTQFRSPYAEIQNGGHETIVDADNSVKMVNPIIYILLYNRGFFKTVMGYYIDILNDRNKEYVSFAEELEQIARHRIAYCKECNCPFMWHSEPFLPKTPEAIIMNCKTCRALLHQKCARSGNMCIKCFEQDKIDNPPKSCLIQ